MKKNLEVVANYHIYAKRSHGGAGYCVQVLKNGKPDYYELNVLVGKEELDLTELDARVRNWKIISVYGKYSFKPISPKEAQEMKNQERIFKKIHRG